MHQIERYTADIYRCIGVVGKYLQVFFFSSLVFLCNAALEMLLLDISLSKEHL